MSSASTPTVGANISGKTASAVAGGATANVDYALVERSLAFHGLPMQKVWEGEHGDQDLVRAAVQPDFSVYAARQKGFVFSDRAKRLKLHQFLARKADVLYGRQRVGKTSGRTPPLERGRPAQAEGLPFDCYFGEQHDKSAHLQQIFKHLKIGDIVYAEITNRTVAGLFARVLCTRPPNFYFLTNLHVKAMMSAADLVPAIDRRGAIRAYSGGDLVMAEILEMTPDSERMVIGMRGVMQRDASQSEEGGSPIVFGLVTEDQMPAQYKELSADKADFTGAKPQRTYTERLDASAEFNNPNGLVELASTLGLDLSRRYTNMADMRGNYPAQEYSAELRQQQASKWAFRSVAEGIEHFKEGRHSEAFQCLNKALSIDPRNVEGLVARGALYANSGSFKKAVEDFETALKLNAGHANARKYMGETLVALGRSYEEEHNIEEAKGAYQACLNIIPAHEEARNSLEFLWSKVQLASSTELTMPALNLKIAEQKRGGVEQRSDKRDTGANRSTGNSKKGKKKKSKSRKRDSSSSSSDSSDSSDSSSPSNSSDSSSSSDSEYSKSKRKRRAARYPPKQRSLSPLSKRMAASMVNESNASGTRPNLPATYSYDQSSFTYNQPDDYEMKVRKFLEMTRDEVNYDQKVKQFVEDTNKYRKERKPGGGSDDKSSSRKKEKHKKRKSSQRESKKSKRSKEKRSKSSKRDKRDSSKGDLDNIGLREALKIIKSLPGLDIPAKLLGMEKSVAALQKETIKKEEDTKWKMLFAKDKASGSQQSTKLQPKQYAFSIDDDDDDDHDDDLIGTLAPPKAPVKVAVANPNARAASPLPLANQRSTSNAAHAASTTTTSVSSTKPPSQHVHAVHSANVAAPVAAATTSAAAVAAKPKAAPPAVMLDKFGSYRLASADDDAGASGRKPPPAGGNAPVALASTQRRSHDDDDDEDDDRGDRDGNKDDDSRRSRSRSHSRRRRERRRARARSDSDDSRSPRRRSGSRQYRRSGNGGGSGRAATTKSRTRSRSVDRSRSRSRSGTYSRSRSRSGSADRHGRQQYGGRGGSGGGRGGYHRGGNGTYYKPHFNNQNQHSSNYRGNNQHYNNRGGQMGYRGGYNNYQNYNNHNNRGGGYVNNRGGGYQQHHQNNYHFNNNGGNGGGMSHHNNHRGRGGWVNRGQHQQGGNYRSYNHHDSRGGVAGGRGRSSRSRSPDDDDDDEGEHGKVSRRRRGGRSSSRDRDDDDDDVRSVSSASRSSVKAVAESTTTTATPSKK